MVAKRDIVKCRKCGGHNIVASRVTKGESRSFFCRSCSPLAVAQPEREAIPIRGDEPVFVAVMIWF